MRYRNLLLLATSALLTIFGAASCEKSGENDGPDKSELKNEFQVGNKRSEIWSVIYTTEEKEGYTTFYLSPTKGLKDMDIMLMADDYIKVQADSPTGEVKLLEKENSLVYNDINISANNGAQVDKAIFNITLTSAKTVKISLDAKMKNGETMLIEYHGLCTKWPVNASEKFDVRLDKNIYSYYFGKPSEESPVSNYYLALTDGTYELEGHNFSLTSEGYVLILDLYAAEASSWRVLPEGVFESSDNNSEHTYSANYSGLKYFASSEDTRGTQYTLSGPVAIEKNNDGTYTITTSFLGNNNVEQTLIYTGEIKMSHGALNYQLPQYDGDIYVKGHSADAVYNGDLFGRGTGAMSIQICDETYDLHEGEGGYSATLMVFGKLFAESKIEIEPGHYEAATTYEKGTWMPCVELNYMGTIIPMGTYGYKDDGSSYGLFSYASKGYVDIEAGKDANEYHIKFDLESPLGNRIHGEYTGKIYVEDASDDKSDDDGTSTLEEDYEMNLDHVKEAKLYTPDEIYVKGIGYCDFTKYNPAAPYCLQIIRFSTEMLPELPGDGIEPKDGDRYDGDIFRLQILGDPSNPKRIVPGEYEVTPERWPAYFRPGVCVKGILLAEEGFVGTSWLHLYKDYYATTDKDGNPIVTTVGGLMDGHACIYGGKVIISKPEGVAENVFRIDVEGIDVRKHRVTGSWTGPIAGAQYEPGYVYDKAE